METKVLPLVKKEKEREKTEADLGFDAIMEANKAKEEKLKKEREKANKSVLKSYRIKN